MTTIDEQRLNEVLQKSLLKGKHTPDGQFCVMEAAAYIANEPWSDAPSCVCPIVRAFMVSWNDSLPTDADRDRLLKPLLTAIVGTRSTDAIAERRSYMALDWLIRVHTPKWLDLRPELQVHAKELRDLDEIVDIAGATAAGKKTTAALTAALTATRAARAARDAARAARDAAWDAARAAAGDAAWDAGAAWAAVAAAGDAAWAAWDAGDAARAAWAAARAARDARDALEPTIEWLQASASELVLRMCAVDRP